MQGVPVSFQFPKRDDGQNVLLWRVASILGTGLGLGGVDHVADTAQHEGHWWCLHAIGGDVVFTSVTYSDDSTGSLAGVTLAEGDRIYGQIVAFKLASGRVEAYRALRNS